MVLEKFDVVLNPGAEIYMDMLDKVLEHEKWVGGVDDFDCWMSGLGEDNVRFRVVYENGTKNVVACLLSGHVPSSNAESNFSFFSFFFVMPQYRGTGVGLELSDIAMSEEGMSESNVFLGAAPYMSQKYANRYGFDKFAAWDMVLYSVELEDLEASWLSLDLTPSAEIVIRSIDHSDTDWSSVLEYNAEINGGIRCEKLLKAWLTSTHSATRIATDQKTNRIVGIGHIREATDNYIVVGPLFGDSPEIAEALLQNLLKPDQQSTVITSKFKHLLFSFPGTNKSGIELLNKVSNGRTRQVTHAIMQFTKNVIKVDTKRIFSGADFILFVI